MVNRLWLEGNLEAAFEKSGSGCLRWPKPRGLEIDQGDYFVLGVFQRGGYQVEAGMRMSGKKKGR